MRQTKQRNAWMKSKHGEKFIFLSYLPFLHCRKNIILEYNYTTYFLNAESMQTTENNNNTLMLYKNDIMQNKQHWTRI